jgi:hypothetical protein
MLNDTSIASANQDAEPHNAKFSRRGRGKNRHVRMAEIAAPVGCNASFGPVSLQFDLQTLSPSA